MHVAERHDQLPSIMKYMEADIRVVINNLSTHGIKGTCRRRRCMWSKDTCSDCLCTARPLILGSPGVNEWVFTGVTTYLNYRSFDWVSLDYTRHLSCLQAHEICHLREKNSMYADSMLRKFSTKRSRSVFRSCDSDQWFFFSRNVGLLNLKIICFHYLKKSFLDQSIQKIFYFILKKEALILMLWHCAETAQVRQGFGESCVTWEPLEGTVTASSPGPYKDFSKRWAKCGNWTAPFSLAQPTSIRDCKLYTLIFRASCTLPSSPVSSSCFQN